MNSTQLRAAALDWRRVLKVLVCRARAHPRGCQRPARSHPPSSQSARGFLPCRTQPEPRLGAQYSGPALLLISKFARAPRIAHDLPGMSPEEAMCVTSINSPDHVQTHVVLALCRTAWCSLLWYSSTMIMRSHSRMRFESSGAARPGRARGFSCLTVILPSPPTLLSLSSTGRRSMKRHAHCSCYAGKACSWRRPSSLLVSTIQLRAEDDEVG
jgi:hypothetical protein